MTSSTEPKLYRIKDTIFRIYAVEEGDHVIWTKFHEDYVQLKDMRRDTKQEFVYASFTTPFLKPLVFASLRLHPWQPLSMV
jgi:hypothetical protein